MPIGGAAQFSRSATEGVIDTGEVFRVQCPKEQETRELVAFEGAVELLPVRHSMQLKVILPS